MRSGIVPVYYPMKSTTYAEALSALTDKLQNEYEMDAGHFEAVANAAIEMKHGLEEKRDEG